MLGKQPQHPPAQPSPPSGHLSVLQPFVRVMGNSSRTRDASREGCGVIEMRAQSAR